MTYTPRSPRDETAPAPELPPLDGASVIADELPKDPPPKRRGRPPGSTRKAKAPAGPSDAQLEQALAQVLVAPAFMWKLRGCNYCYQHTLTAGPRLAHEIVEDAKQNEALRALLVRLYTVAGKGGLYGALLLYVLPPLLHHGPVPPHLRDTLGGLLGVPAPEPHDHPSEPQGGWEAYQQAGGQAEPPPDWA